MDGVVTDAGWFGRDGRRRKSFDPNRIDTQTNQNDINRKGQRPSRLMNLVHRTIHYCVLLFGRWLLTILVLRFVRGNS